MKRAISIIVAAAMLFAMCAFLPGCGDKVEDDGSLYSKAGFAADDIVMTVNGEDITADEYFFVLQYYCYNYFVQNYGEIENWDDIVYEDMTYAEYIMNDTVESIKYYHSFYTFAEENGVTLTDEDYAAIEEAKQQIIENYFGSEEDFLSSLESSYHVSEEVFVYLNCTVPYLYDKIYSAIYGGGSCLESIGEDAVDDYIEENGIMKCAHILIKTVDDSYEPLDDAEIAEKDALFEELLERAKSGEDFYALIEEYGEDPGMTNSTGYTFNGEGMSLDSGNNMMTEFTEGTAALEIGEIGTAETSYGHHIILRLEPDKEEIAEYICNDDYDSMLTLLQQQSTAEFGKKYDKIDISKLF